MFGDPNLVQTKTRELRALRQATSVSAYASEFQRLQAFIAWNDQAFYDQFYHGLLENVKDGLATVETRANTLEELIQKAQRIDNRIAERISERRFSHAEPQSATAPSNPFSLPTTIPSVYDAPSEPPINNNDFVRLSEKASAQE
jgi:hypothetical protein